MKCVILLLSLSFLLVFVGIHPVTGNAPFAQKENANSAAEQPTWEIPIAAGVWYPTDGAVPKKPMRYYRVRCWPGCHIGSSLGKYPDKKLHDKPIWPTSTVGTHADGSSKQE